MNNPGTGSLEACCVRLGITPKQYMKRLHNDIRFFKQELWLDRGLNKVAPVGPVELEIADWNANGPRLRQLLAFRGIGKTYDTATLVCFRGRRDRHRRMAVYSKSISKAKETLQLIRAWLDEVWFLKDLAPDRNSRDTTTGFDFANASENRSHSVSVLGLGGQLEGGRAHTIIADDVETKLNTKTPEAREELLRLTAEFTNILFPDVDPDKGGPVDPVEVVVLGTYKHEESVYLKLEDRGYATRTVPIVYPSPGDKVRGLSPYLAQRLAADPSLADTPTIPARFPEDPEVSMRRASGRHEFAMEHKLVCDLGVTDRYPLRLSDFIVISLGNRDKVPISLGWGERDHNGSTVIEGIPMLGMTGDRFHRPIFIDPLWQEAETIAWFDPAGRGSDRTGGSAVAQLNGYFYWKGRMSLAGGSSEEDMNKMCLFCRKHNVRRVFIESNADTLDTYVNLFNSVLLRHYLQPGDDPLYPKGWSASLVRDPAITHNTVQKELRIIGALEPVLSQHRIAADPQCFIPDPDCEDHQTVQYQLTRITRERGCLREDGEADSLCGCIRAWDYVLSARPEVLAERRRQSEAERQKKALNELFKQPSKKATNWRQDPISDIK